VQLDFVGAAAYGETATTHSWCSGHVRKDNIAIANEVSEVFAFTQLRNNLAAAPGKSVGKGK